jgi:hypothetical protein
MKTLREYEISRPWPRSRSRAASTISPESSVITNLYETPVPER